MKNNYELFNKSFIRLFFFYVKLYFVYIYCIGQNICNQHRAMLKSVPNLTCLKNETNYTTTANSSGVWSHSMP